MGEPVTVVEKATSRPGYYRYETNRSFTGMGHEEYHKDDVIHRDRPADRIARALFASGQVDEVHVYAQSILVKAPGQPDLAHIKEILEDIYIYYRPGVEVPTPESFGAEA